MDVTGYGNFGFLFDLNMDLYEVLNKAEKNARINYSESGKSIRDALEKFVNAVVKEKHLEHKVAYATSLQEKIKALRFDLPRAYPVPFTQEDGNEGERYTFDFIRIFGNSCSHVEVKKVNPRITFENLMKCLGVFHEALIRYYGRRIGRRVKPFNENLMPIGKLVIYKSYVPSDHERSKCAREFLGYTVEDGEKGFYALVRMYNRNETGGAFMIRNQKCFLEVSKKNPRPPEGMVYLNELTPKQSRDSDFYMICYSFNQEPHSLEGLDLKRITMEQRLQICRKLAVCMDNLHNSKVPVFHRLLSYESVFLSEIDGDWTPYIVKFDYAKIIADRPTETIVANTMNASKRGREKYLPPEWPEIEKNLESADWEKVDVYSLGVLMTDLLKGSFSKKVADFDELEELGVPDAVLDALDGMLAQSPRARSTMKAARGELCAAVR